MLQTLGDVVTCALALIAVILVPAAVVRAWWPAVKQFFLALFVLPRSEEAEAEPGAAGTGSVGAQTSSHDPVLAGTHQVEPEEPYQNEPGREPSSSLRNLSRLEEIVWLATLRNEDGNYRHSANEITKFVGGTAADVKATIAAVRAKSTPAPKPSSRLDRDPVNGWR